MTAEELARSIIHASGGDPKRALEAASIVEAWRDEKIGYLLGAFAIHADRYQRDFGLNGLHPVHYDLLKECGARMDDFKRATNAEIPQR